MKINKFLKMYAKPFLQMDPGKNQASSGMWKSRVFRCRDQFLKNYLT